MELILNINGEVEASNFSEYKTLWLEKLEGVDLAPQTDEEYADAEVFAKSCKAAEDAIKDARERATAEVQDISLLFQEMEEVSVKLRDVRLALNKEVKAEKERKKSEVIADAVSEIDGYITNGVERRHGAYLNGFFRVDHDGFSAAVKGKRSIERIKEAVGAEADRQMQIISDHCQVGEENFKLITGGEENHIHLFPDINDVLLKPADEVKAMLKGRLAEYQLKLERDKSEAKKSAEVTTTPAPTTTAAPVTTTMQPEPVPQSRPGQPVDRVEVHGQGSPDIDDFVMTVRFMGTAEDVKAIAKQVDETVSQHKEVVSINLKRWV